MALAALALLVGCRAEGAATPAGGLVQTVPSIGELMGTPRATIPPLPALDPAAVAQGKVVYDQHCATCHGVNLEGQPNWQEPNPDGSFRAPPHDASGHTWHHSDALLIETIRLGGMRLPPEIGGRSDMPAFGQTLTDEEIAAVLAYIKSAWPADIRAAQWEMTILSGEQ